MLTLQLCYFEELSSTHKVILPFDFNERLSHFPNFIKMAKPCRGIQMKATFNFNCDVLRYADFMQINWDLSIIEA